MPETMEALVVLEPTGSRSGRSRCPTPGPNEVLARVRAVSICGTDAHLIRGDYPGFWPPAFPFIPGHEWAGEIVGARAGRRALRLERSATGWPAPPTTPAASARSASRAATTCARTTAARGSTSQYGHNVQGADATYVVHGVKTIFRLPDGLTFDEGAAASTRPRSPSTSPTAAASPRATRWRSPAPGAIGLLAGDAARDPRRRPGHRHRADGGPPGEGRRAWASRPSTRARATRSPTVAADDRRPRRRRRPRVRRRAGHRPVGPRDAPPRRSLRRRRDPDRRRRDRDAAARPRRARAGRLARLGRRDAAGHAARRAGPDAGAARS